MIFPSLKKRLWLSSLILLLGLVGCAKKPVDFALPDVDGRIHRLSDYHGKWVVVNYWATWCPPCLEELPELELFHAAHKDKDAVVLGINMEEIEPRQLRAFLERYEISYPVLRSPLRSQTELGAVPGLPTSFLVSPKGEVVTRKIGEITAEWLEKSIK